MSEMEGDETPPPIILVSPRFRPVSIRNVAKVTMKLGSLVFIRIQPLMKPMASDTTNARPTPTQTLVLKYQLNMDAVRAELMTATPVDRSNSPPIISNETPTAIIPMVELP